MCRQWCHYAITYVLWTELRRPLPSAMVISAHFAVPSACPLYPQKQTCAVQLGMSAKGQKQTQAPPQRGYYSITSLARLCTDCGTVMPSVLAVFRLTISSTFVVCWTGRSAGLSPLRIFPA